MDETPEVFTIKSLIEQVEAGERMFIHVSQFATFITETEYLRIPCCIKTSVVGDRVVLERWDVGEDAGLERRSVNEAWLH